MDGDQDSDMKKAVADIYNSSERERERERKSGEKNEEVAPILLFEKTLDSEDSNTVLNRLVVGRCKDMMISTLESASKSPCDYVKVMTKDPEGVEYELRFMRYTPKGKYVLTHQWADLVAANGLAKGDIIVGWGNLVAAEFFVMLRFLRRSQQPPHIVDDNHSN